MPDLHPSHIKYDEHSYLPRFASTAQGEPFNGRTFSSRGIADWIGGFRNGLPHGEFLLVLGDRQSSYVTFENGVIVNQER